MYVRLLAAPGLLRSCSGDGRRDDRAASAAVLWALRCAGRWLFLQDGLLQDGKVLLLSPFLAQQPLWRCWLGE